MKILDSFIYLANHEADLLYLKLVLESPIVDRWFAAECHYTYRGQYKGPLLADLLESDPRFAPYRNRLTVISLPKSLCAGGDASTYDPGAFAEAEWALRDAALPYLLADYQPEDRVFVSDVDEMIDFTSAWRTDRILNVFRHNNYAPLQFDRVRYWYDFDNRGWRAPMDMTTPCFTIQNLRDGVAKLRDKKWVGHHIHNEDKPVIFEYSFCFDRAGIDYKFGTSLHTRWQKEAIDVSLMCNHWTMRNDERVDFNNSYQWFETVELTDKNSPAYVRENLATLRTNLVPANYAENRLRVYGQNPQFPGNHS